MGKKLTKELFIEKAQKIHQDKFDYSLVEYQHVFQKINIKCNQCLSIFWQLPSNHLNGYGCKQCAINLLKTNTSEFIEKSKKIHGDNKYNYSQAVFNSSRNRVKLICNDCLKLFEQMPGDHLDGHGCSNCSVLKRSKLATNTIEKFLTKAKEIHGDLFDYSKVIYINNKTKIEIICKIHGSFFQRPDSHLFGRQKCPKCKEASSVKNFGSSKSVSKIENKWLDFLEISQDSRQKEIIVNDKVFIVDAFDSKNNTIYEFLGDFWHGNIKVEKFSANKMNPRLKKTYGSLYEETMDRISFFEKAGYIVVYIWENDFIESMKSSKIGNPNEQK